MTQYSLSVEALPLLPSSKQQVVPSSVQRLTQAPSPIPSKLGGENEYFLESVYSEIYRYLTRQEQGWKYLFDAFLTESK